MGRAERQGCGHPDAPAKLACRQYRLASRVDVGRDPRRVIAESRAFFRQCDAARRSCNELYAELRLETRDAPADHGLGDAKPLRGRRDASSIRNFHEGSEIVNFHPAFPFLQHSSRF